MDTLDWIITVGCLAVTGAAFLRLLAIDRELSLWRAQVEAEEGLQAERDRQRRQDEAVSKISDVELA